MVHYCGLVLQLTHLVETMLLTFILLSRLCDLSVSLLSGKADCRHLAIVMNALCFSSCLPT